MPMLIAKVFTSFYYFFENNNYEHKNALNINSWADQKPTFFIFSANPITAKIMTILQENYLVAGKTACWKVERSLNKYISINWSVKH